MSRERPASLPLPSLPPHPSPGLFTVNVWLTRKGCWWGKSKPRGRCNLRDPVFLVMLRALWICLDRASGLMVIIIEFGHVFPLFPFGYTVKKSTSVPLREAGIK